MKLKGIVTTHVIVGRNRLSPSISQESSGKGICFAILRVFHVFNPETNVRSVEHCHLILIMLNIAIEYVGILDKYVIISVKSIGKDRRSRRIERPGQMNRRVLCCGGSPEHLKGEPEYHGSQALDLYATELSQYSSRVSFTRLFNGIQHAHLPPAPTTSGPGGRSGIRMDILWGTPGTASQCPISESCEPICEQRAVDR